MSMRINMRTKIHVHTKSPMPMNIMRVKMNMGTSMRTSMRTDMSTATDTGMLME